MVMTFGHTIPWVILVINVNISLVGLILLPSMFQISSKMERHGLEDVNPFNMLRTKDWLKLKAQDSTFSILVIQDHIESIGKPILLRGGMRSCLMACLLKVLSDMLQSPQPLSHIHICPKPKAKLGPTESLYPTPPSSVDIATARNPSLLGLTDRDLGLTEMGL